jgi:hypothetical protein
MKEIQNVKPQSQTLEVQSVKHIMTIDHITATVWSFNSFAPEWYQDALNESRSDNDHNARRREIVFAVNFAESYLVEWVRDDVLHRDFNGFFNYFPAGVRYSALEKWKGIPKLLRDAGLIPQVPDLGRPYWEEFRELVRYRDGLVHAVASRPDTSSLSPTEKPLPPKSVLDQLEPGWALRVVIELIRQLHKTVGTTPPPWLIDP